MEPLVAITWHPDRRSLRSLGLASALLFAGLGSAALYSAHARSLEHWPSWLAWSLAMISTSLAVTAPQLLRPWYLAVRLASYPLAWLTAWFALLTTFFLLITPLAFARRLLIRLIGGAQPTAAARGSAWSRAPATRDKASYLKQF
jgi:hypothetical protein